MWQCVKYAAPVHLNNLFCVLQVQNMSHSIDILDQRTQRDLKFVENMEFQLKNMENKFKEVEDGHESNFARQYKVNIMVFRCCDDIFTCLKTASTRVCFYICLHLKGFSKSIMVICIFSVHQSKNGGTTSTNPCPGVIQG